MVEIDPASLERHHLWRCCSDLVAFDTVATNTSIPAADYVANQLDLPGWTVRIHRDEALGSPKGSVVAIAGPNEPGGLILSGHLDVVPFASQPGWTRDPLRLSRDGERIYGRGVADMKGFIAQCIVMARALSVDGLRCPLAFVFTSDEEVGCLGSGRLIEHLPRLFAGWEMPQRAVIGEPTDFTVYGAHKGHVRCSVSVQGRAGHSSRPDLGTNAIAAMGEAIRAIEWFASSRGRESTPEQRRLFPEYPDIAFNVGTIAGGSAVNMIAEACSLSLGFRPRPGDDVPALLVALESTLRAAVRAAYPDAWLELRDVVETPAMHGASEGPVTDALRAIQQQGEFLGAPFATDGGQFEKAGIRSYIWGPGELAQAHQPDESLLIESFIRMPALLSTLVRKTCGAE